MIQNKILKHSYRDVIKNLLRERKIWKESVRGMKILYAQENVENYY